MYSFCGFCTKCFHHFYSVLLHFLVAFQSRKGLDVDIVTANASKKSDKLQILNSIALPRAATKQLQMDADLRHERNSEMKRGDVGCQTKRVMHQNPLEAKLPF